MKNAGLHDNVVRAGFFISILFVIQLLRLNFQLFYISKTQFPKRFHAFVHNLFTFLLKFVNLHNILQTNLFFILILSKRVFDIFLPFLIIISELFHNEMPSKACFTWHPLIYGVILFFQSFERYKTSRKSLIDSAILLFTRYPVSRSSYS